MPFTGNRRVKNLAGADFVMMMMQTAEEQQAPFIEHLSQLFVEMHDPSRPITERHAVAQADLLPFDRTVFNVVASAAGMAAQVSKSLQTVSEVAVVGARMALRWPYYLNAGYQQHPRLETKPELPEKCELDAYLDDEGTMVVNVNVADGVPLRLHVNGQVVGPS